VSVGAAVTGATVSLDPRLADADRALYDAKEGGRARAELATRAA
jgi:PleD family two-component response regulator